MVITNLGPEEDNTTGNHTLALNSEGLIQESQARYSTESGGQLFTLTETIPFGEASPKIKLETEYNLVFQEKVKASSEYITLAKKSLLNDATIKSYSKEEFLAMVDQQTSSLSVEENSLSVSEILQPNLGSNKTKAPLVKRGGEVTHDIHRKRYLIVESWFFGRPFRIYMETNISITILDADSEYTSNKYYVTSRMLITYGKKMHTWINIHNNTEYTKDGYKKKTELDTHWSMKLPVRYGDDRINFDLQAKINLTIESMD